MEISKFIGTGDGGVNLLLYGCGSGAEAETYPKVNGTGLLRRWLRCVGRTFRFADTMLMEMLFMIANDCD